MNGPGSDLKTYGGRAPPPIETLGGEPKLGFDSHRQTAALMGWDAGAIGRRELGLFTIDGSSKRTPDRFRPYSPEASKIPSLKPNYLLLAG